MGTKEPKDVRERAVSRLAKDISGHHAGAAIKQLTVLRMADGKLINFTAPSAPGLSIRAAIDAALKARRDREKVEENRYEGALLGETWNYGPEISLFEYFSGSMVSVLFSFSTLEYFANDVISQHPNAYVGFSERAHRARRGQRRRTRTYQLNMKSAERKNLDEKLSAVLPQLLGCQSPKGLAIWGEFLSLRRIRNDIVHMKGEMLNPTYRNFDTDPDRRNPLRDLLQDDPMKWVAISVRCLEYFAPHCRRMSLDWLDQVRAEIDV